MQWIKKGMKNENGEVMLESLIVYSVTIFLLFFILAIFSVPFQHWNIQTVANESVIRVAQTYNKHTKRVAQKCNPYFYTNYIIFYCSSVKSGNCKQYS